MLKVWDWHMHTIINRKDGQQGPGVQHRKLYSMFCDNNTYENGFVFMYGSVTFPYSRNKPVIIVNQPYFNVKKKKKKKRSSCCVLAVMTPASIHEDVGLFPGLAPWVKDSALL